MVNNRPSEFQRRVEANYAVQWIRLRGDGVFALTWNQLQEKIAAYIREVLFDYSETSAALSPPQEDLVLTKHLTLFYNKLMEESKDTMWAVVMDAPGIENVTIRRVPIPKPKSGQLLVRV